MKEKHLAYKIYLEEKGMVSSHREFTEDDMLTLLQEVSQTDCKGIYWIFKEFDGKPQEALAIIDCEKGRIYYHYSGEVENINTTIKKLSGRNTC